MSLEGASSGAADQSSLDWGAMKSARSGLCTASDEPMGLPTKPLEKRVTATEGCVNW